MLNINTKKDMGGIVPRDATVLLMNFQQQKTPKGGGGSFPIWISILVINLVLLGVKLLLDNI